MNHLYDIESQMPEEKQITFSVLMEAFVFAGLKQTVIFFLTRLI